MNSYIPEGGFDHSVRDREPGDPIRVAAILKAERDALLAALKDAVRCINAEVDAGGDGRDLHPILQAHANVAERCEALIAEVEK